MKSKNDFDEFIRGRMRDMEAEGQPEGWDLLADRLSEEEGGTAAADEKLMEAVVFEKMSQLEAPFQPAHWNKLETRLNEEYRFVNKIIRYKSLELSVFLLLVALFLNYFPETTPKEKVPLGTSAIASDIETKETTTSNSISTGNDLATSELGKRASKTEVKQSDVPTETGNQPAFAAPSGDKTTATAPEFTKQSIPPQAALAQESLARQPKSASLLDALQKPSLLAKELQAVLPGHQSQLKAPTVINSPISQVDLTGESTGLDLVLLASLSPVPGLTITPSLEDKEAIAKIKPSPKENFIRFGVQSSGDFNRIITPPTYISGEQHALDRYALGYSGGITFSWGNKRLEMESGLIYSFKQYLPLPVSEIDYSLTNGLSGEELKSFEFDMISIPLNVRHHFIPNGKWRFYYTAGISLHTVMQAEYFFTSPSRPLPTGPPTNSFGPPIPPNNNNTKAGVEKSAFTKGLLEGGAFEQNSFFTANLGIGLERYISHRTSLFAQPQYQHTVLHLVPNGGVGPFQDKINTMRLIFGMRVKL